MLFDDGFLQNWRAEIENEQRKERRKLTYRNSLYC